MSVRSDISAAQFENVNSLRSYPFEDETSLMSNDGRKLPSDVVVDLHMVVPALFDHESQDGIDGNVFEREVEFPNVIMTSVHISPSMVSACFLSSCGDVRNAASVTVSRERFVPYMPYRMEKLAGSSDIGGIVTFGGFTFPGTPETYLLGAKVHPCCISVEDPPRLRSFFDARSGLRASGDVEIAFSGYVNSSRTGNSFSLSLEKGAESELASICANITGPDECGATPISSINGVLPDKDGNIVLWFH